MTSEQTQAAITIFFGSSSHPKDQELFKELYTHMLPFQNQSRILITSGEMITAGSVLTDTLNALMREAQIVVPLISPDFMAFEVDTLLASLQELERLGIIIIPVLLRPTAWSDARLQRYKSLPTNGKPVTRWSDQDSAFMNIAQEMMRTVDELQRRRNSPPERSAKSRLYNFHYERNPFFTNRRETLEALHSYLWTGQNSNTKKVALSGVAGIGKTMLASEYIYRYGDAYTTIHWLNVTPTENFNANLLALIAQMGIALHSSFGEQEPLTALQRWLQYHDGWLLVLDNVEDFGILKQLLPLQSSGHVLLTTHLEAKRAFAHPIIVTPLADEEGALLLLRQAGIIDAQATHAAVSLDDYHYALQIAQEFDGYPLALEHAGAYIDETNSSLSSYLTHYRTRRTTLLELQEQPLQSHRASVLTTLSLIFEQIAQTNAHALALLHLIAFMHSDAFLKSMLTQGASVLDEPLHTLAADELTLNNTLRILRTFSLIPRSEDSITLNMHRIVRAVLERQLAVQQQQDLARQVVRLTHTTLPPSFWQLQPAGKAYLPQAQHCATLIERFQLLLPEGIQLLAGLGTYCLYYGSYTDAEISLLQLLRLQEQQHTDLLIIAQTLSLLGQTYQELGRYQDAEEHHRRALTIREQLLGPDDPQTTTSLHNIAMTYRAQRDYQQAEQLYEQVMAIEERTLGPHHPDLATTLNNLAELYMQKEDPIKATAAYQRALTIYEQAVSNAYTTSIAAKMIHTLDGLGTLAEEQEDYQQAEILYQRALTISQAAFGEEHLETAHSINKLADIYSITGRDQQAEASYLQAIAISEKVVGTEHADTALFINNLAVVISKQKRYQQAEQLYQRALRIYQLTLGDEHPHTQEVMDNLTKLQNKMAAQETKMEDDHEENKT